MPKVDIKKLIEAGAHFGHLTRRWNPKMKPYIFMEKNGIHIIDLKKTALSIEEAAEALKGIVSKGHRVLFVGTKKQAKGTIANVAKSCGQNWVSERWLGGMLTNFSTIRKSIKRLQNIDKMESDGTFDKITKKERLQLSRERDKLRKILSGIESMNKLPGALFIVDIKKESIAVKEAQRLGIPIFAIVDTNCDPDEVNYIIPSNDDAVRAISLILSFMSEAVNEGNARAEEFKAQQDAEKERHKKEQEKEDEDGDKEVKVKVRRVRMDKKEGGKKFVRAKGKGGQDRQDGAKSEQNENVKQDKESSVKEEAPKTEDKPKAEENPKSEPGKKEETENKNEGK